MTNGEKLQKTFPDVWNKEMSGTEWKEWVKEEYKEPTTKNDLGVDCIDRQTTIAFVCKNTKEILKDTMPLEVKLSDDYLYENISKIMRNPKVLPSVTPQDIDYKAQYERLSQKAEIVISQLRADRDRLIRPKGYWIDTKENSTNTRGQIIHEVICSECNGIAYFRSIDNKYIGANTCPNCGADMREEQRNDKRRKDKRLV